MTYVPRIKPPRVPRSARTVRLSWEDYAKLRFTAVNGGISLSTTAGVAITLHAPLLHARDMPAETPDKVFLSLKLLPEEALALDNLALLLEEESLVCVTLGDAFRTIVSQMPVPKMPLGLSDDIAAWLRVTYSRFKTARPERPYREGWQIVGPSFLSEQRRALRANRRRVRNLGRRR